MRITEARMVEVAAQNMAKARNAVADAAGPAQTGVRVTRPSDDPAAWATGRRADARQRISEARGSAIGAAQDHLAETELAFGTIGSLLARAKELAVQAASETYNADDRAHIAVEIRALQQAALAAANARSSDGEFVLGGSLGAVAPFSSTGAYVGDGYQRQLEIADGGAQAITIAGDRLTAAAGVDVLSTLDALATALETNTLAGVQAGVGEIDMAIRQVSLARSQIGGLASALDQADATRRDLELVLAEIEQRAIGADPIEAATRLTQAANALETAQVLTNRIVEITTLK
jgi:flagellar hook-associated protein 3 FlgL